MRRIIEERLSLHETCNVPGEDHDVCGCGMTVHVHGVQLGTSCDVVNRHTGNDHDMMCPWHITCPRCAVALGHVPTRLQRDLDRRSNHVANCGKK